MVTNKSSEYLDEKTILTKLSILMENTFNNAYNKHKDDNISMRVAVYNSNK